MLNSQADPPSKVIGPVCFGKADRLICILLPRLYNGENVCIFSDSLNHICYTMTEVRRYGGRTYGKSGRDQSSSSQAFDEIFSKAKPTAMKWGNASYSKPRMDEGPDTKRAKVDSEESSDPFSFDLDSDKSPKKKRRTIFSNLTSRGMVLQPAVRLIAEAKSPFQKPTALDDGVEEDLTLKKGNVNRTYTRGAGRKIKEEHEVSQLKMDSHLTCAKSSKNILDSNSVESSEESPSTSKEQSESIDDFEELEDGLYIEKDDGSSFDVKDESFMLQDENEDIFKRPKPGPQFMSVGEEVTVKFRSRYLNPAVYSKFTESITPKDPVGRLSNSKVVHKNVLKHDSGTTLIVVCSPKVDDEGIKQSNTQIKYFKDNVKDLMKSKKKSAEEIASGKTVVQAPETDPYDMDKDPDFIELHVKQEPSPVIVSSENDDGQATDSSQSQLRRSVRNIPDQTPKIINVETIVKNAQPPRKYHRIFRSRNKHFMEPQENESSESTTEKKGLTDSSQSETVSSQEGGNDTIQSCEIKEEITDDKGKQSSR